MTPTGVPSSVARAAEALRRLKGGVTIGDLWGGLAAMLVALPSAIAFGVIIYGPLGGTSASMGAVAGVLGAGAMGLIAAAFGGTRRLISAPCAPAAAVMSAFALDLTGDGITPERAVVMLGLIAISSGILQVIFSAARLGRLIRYIPYPVVCGYLSGVGLVIVVGQLPIFLGVPKGTSFWQSITTPTLWNWQSMVVGAVTAATILGAPYLTKKIPAAILGLAAGVLAYVVLARFNPALLSLTGNVMVVGQLGGSSGGMIELILGHWTDVVSITPGDVVALAGPALTLAILLSIDTLKTCVVLDTITRSRHDSDQELFAQGSANIISALVGGIPGAGQMGATLINLASGATGRMSGFIAGALALVAFALLSDLVSWVPVAALAGILIVIGVKMFDWHSLQLLKSRSTILDFVIIVVVVVIAKSVSLIAASAAGIGLAILLFVREQVGTQVVYRKTTGAERFSKQLRSAAEMEALTVHGRQTVIFELQGSLFFGTADQLYAVLEPELARSKYIVIDLRRVHSVDMTAAHVLELVADMLPEGKCQMIFTNVPRRLATGRDIEHYLGEVGLIRDGKKIILLPALDDALEWVEDRILGAIGLSRDEGEPLELRELDLLRGRKEDTIAAIEGLVERVTVPNRRKIFSAGDRSDEVFIVRRGQVRIVLPLGNDRSRVLTTIGRGCFFGEMAFLDQSPRSADAVADGDVDLFVLSRARFDQFATEHRRAALQLLNGFANTIAGRLRHADAELASLEGA